MKQRKKQQIKQQLGRLVCSLCIICLLMLAGGWYFMPTEPVFAAEPGKRIFDGAGLFSEEEEEKLQQSVETAIEKTTLDIVVVTTTGTGGKSAMAYADDFYDSHGFGYEALQGNTGESGILLLIDMGGREIWISTAGRAISEFSDARIDSMVEEITDRLSDGKSMKAAERFISLCVNEKPIGDRLRTSLLAAVIVSGICTVVMFYHDRGRSGVDSHTYLKENRYEVKSSQDHFTGTTTVTRHIEKTSSGGSSGSGSSVHTSSSGSSHGGGGGKF